MMVFSPEALLQPCQLYSDAFQTSLTPKMLNDTENLHAFCWKLRQELQAQLDEVSQQLNQAA